MATKPTIAQIKTYWTLKSCLFSEQQSHREGYFRSFSKYNLGLGVTIEHPVCRYGMSFQL